MARLGWSQGKQTEHGGQGVKERGLECELSRAEWRPARGNEGRMRTNDAKAAIKGYSLIEPDDSVEVQVVGGLIQHQQCGLHE